MARRYRRRKQFRIKLKNQTILTIISLLFFVAASIVTLTFFQSGSALDVVYLYLYEQVGFAVFFLPLVLASLGFLLLRLKFPLSRPHVSIGLLLVYGCMLTLGQGGLLGSSLWERAAAAISAIGAFILLSGLLGIGVVVLFNMSMEDLAQIVGSLTQEIKALTGKLFAQKESAVFIEKNPSRIKDDFKKDDKTPPSPKIPLKTSGPSAAVPTKEMPGGFVPQTIPDSQRVWEYPPLSLLSTSSGQKADRGDLKNHAHVIEKTLESFGISARVVEVNLGPAVTQYALEIALGTKVSKITSLTNDLALALAAPTGQIRIEAPIPGRSLVGIEIPNRSLEFVTLRHMLSSDTMKKRSEKLLVALGLDVSGSPVIANIGKMPHVLIAGTTGSGKSVLVNSWISSLLFRATPQEVRLIMVDPKRVELIGYNGIPHLLTPVIVEPDKILSALKWAMQEMDRRYKLFAEVGVRNIDGYNELSGFQAIPYIVIFIDELADLMAYAPVEVEDAICRIAQMARATGIHLVVATQRPSVDVITGLIKANIPSRIAFNVSSMIDSRVIIDMPGAEKLLGRGDMLYIPPEQAKPTRIQGTFISEQEVNQLVQHLKSRNVPVEYTKEITSMPLGTLKKSGSGTSSGDEDGKDALFEDAVRVVCQYDRASASLLQRRLSIGYARAARILDQLESNGIVGIGEGSKPRDVLVRNPDEYFASLHTESSAQTQ